MDKRRPILYVFSKRPPPPHTFEKNTIVAIMFHTTACTKIYQQINKNKKYRNGYNITFGIKNDELANRLQELQYTFMLVD